MILYPDDVRKITENEGNIGDEGVPCFQPPLGAYQDYLTDTEMHQFVTDLRNVVFLDYIANVDLLSFCPYG